MSNELRAAIIAVVQSAFPVMVLLGVDLSDAAIAAIVLVIQNTITLLALIFPGPKTVVERVVEVQMSPRLEPGGGGRGI
jgi:hypothetical protein